MNKIGLVSVYFQRGAGYIAKQIIDAFKWHCDIEIPLLARMSIAGGAKRLSFFGEHSHTNLFLYPSYVVDSKDFENWIKFNNLDTVIFVEEQFTRNLVEVCNQLGVKAYNYVVWENINPADLDYYRKFQGIICPTLCSYNLLYIKYLLNNAYYVPWGIDLKLFKYHEPIIRDKSIIFFPGGWGGTHNRKNEDAVIKAFSNIAPRDKTILKIHTQLDNQSFTAQNIIKTSGNIHINDMIKKYADADIICLPSRWEGNGLGFYEANAIGRPVITVDYPPMNEHIFDFHNGSICAVKELKEFPGIFAKSAEIDIMNLGEEMMWLSENKDHLYDTQINSRIHAEKFFDWRKNSKKLIEIFE